MSVPRLAQALARGLPAAVFLLAFAGLAAGGDRPVIAKPCRWTFLECTSEMKHASAAFGAGSHRLFIPDSTNAPVVTSRLRKDGVTWETSTSNGTLLDFWRIPPGGSRELIFTTYHSYSPWREQLLVDVHVAEQEIVVLTAVQPGYVCYRIKHKPIPPPPAGRFILEPRAANSENWYVETLFDLGQAGARFMDYQHASAVARIRLTGLNTIEVLDVGQNCIPFEINLSSGVPKRNGSLLCSEVDHPTNPIAQPWTEEDLINHYFGQSENDALKMKVERFEGTKTRILEILSQIKDQRKAAEIRQRVEAAYAAPVPGKP